MTLRTTRRKLLACGLGLASVLAGCSDDNTTDTTSVAAPDTAAFVSGFTSGLASLKSFAGLTSTSFADLFDAGYLDTGVTKADVVAALQAEAFATAVSPDFPSFTQVAFSNVSITNCDNTTKLCTLTATLTNSDADTTSVSFTSQVKFTDKVRLYGDQSKS